MTGPAGLARLCAMLLVLLICSGQARAAATCSGIVSAVNFGSVSVRLGISNQTSGQLQVTCSGVPGVAINVCVMFGSGGGGAASGQSPRYLRRSDNAQLTYELRTGGYGGQFGTLASVLLVMPVVLGSGTVILPIFADITAQSVGVGSGLYESTFAGNSDIRLVYGVTSCAGSGTTVSVPDFKVSADVVPSCELDVSAVDFGNIPAVIQSPISGQGTVTVRCTADTSYSVTLGLGLYRQFQTEPGPGIRALPCDVCAQQVDAPG